MTGLTMLLRLMSASMAAHFDMSIPNGATNMPQIPASIMSAMRGILMMSPRMPSISRVPKPAAAVPTVRNMSDFATAWKIVRKSATQIVW